MQVDLNALRERFQRFNLRERLLLMLALVAVLYQLGDSLLLSGQMAEVTRLENSIVAQRQQMSQLALQVAEVTHSLQNDPNAPLRQRNEVLRKRIKDGRSHLEVLAQELIAPRQMAALLEQVLAEQEGLQLQRLRTLEPRVLNSPPDDSEVASSAFPVYAHGFAVEFSGGYFETLKYLESLEKLQSQFYWDLVDFQVDEYPQSRVRLELHTLSLSEEWIGV